MLIPVTLSSSSSAAKLPSGLAKLSNEEIVLIELQGSLEVEATHPSERDGKLVGKLTTDDTLNKPVLLIGNHLLEGKVASLPKPFAVLVRKELKRPSPLGGQRGLDKDDDDDNEDVHDKQATVDPESMAVDAHHAPSEPAPGWNILGLVKKKIIFSKRPMPVVGKR